MSDATPADEAHEPASTATDQPVDDSTDGGTNGDATPAARNPDNLTEDVVAAAGIADIDVTAEMRQSFLDYAMSVITSRALPDARDGLKPVHRRILWSMFDTGMRPDRPHKKCATVVGDVIANYHPHGDNSIYEALVRMGQSFSLSNPLVNPHGNFGSPSDPPAAYRYTECRLSELAMSMLAGLDENTVDFTANFDGSRNEPDVLPSRFPNLVVNGSQGIAVGMATNIPPHNLGEVIDACVHLLMHPDASLADVIRLVPAPDFPTGGSIMGTTGVHDAYLTGRGSVRLRATASIESVRNGTQIVVTEIPYQSSVEAIEEKVAELVRRKRADGRRQLDGVRTVRNESSKGNTRLVIELKNDARAQVVLNQLFQETPLETKFSVNMLALVDGEPRTLNLLQLLQVYVGHQIEVVRRRSEHRLQKARDRAHIVEGLLRALDMVDAIIAAIRASYDRADSLAQLMAEPFSFSERQANHILDLRLARLNRLSRTDLEEEMASLRTSIAELEGILSDDQKLRGVIIDELEELREKHKGPRRTQIESYEGELTAEDLIPDEPLVVTLSANGFVKAMSPDGFRSQGRGGSGVRGTNLDDDDVPVRVLATTAHAYLLFFTSRGKVYRLKAYQLPKTGRTTKGRSVVNFLQLAEGETVQTVIDAVHFRAEDDLLFVTRAGRVKRTALSLYDTSRTPGLIAIKLDDGDELARVLKTSSDDDALLVTKAGRAIRFSVSDVRRMGRTAAGVKGIRLRDDDVVAAADVLKPDGARDLLLITDTGIGKRVETGLFPVRRRGGMGVWGIKLLSERGTAGESEVVAGARMVEDDDEVLAFSTGGNTIRTRASDISRQGRYSRGVRVMRLRDDERVAAIAPYDIELDDEATDGADVATDAVVNGAVTAEEGSDETDAADSDAAGAAAGDSADEANDD